MAFMTTTPRSGVAAFGKYTYRPEEISLGWEYEWQSFDKTKYSGFFCDLGSYGDWNKARKEGQLPVKLPKYFQVCRESTGFASCCEIKSVVAPLNIHKILIRKILRENDLKNPGKKTSGSSGIHVHIGRDSHIEALGPKVFIFLHDKDNKEFFRNISNRSKAQFDDWAQQSGKSYVERYGLEGCRAHSGIINTERAHTYEMRLFGAQPNVLIPAVEFADALFTLAPQVEEITVENFTTYVSRTRKYKELNEHIGSCM